MGIATDKSKNGHTEEDNIGETVKNHIKKFPVMESHYIREKSKRQFSASNLNIHSMCELYQSEKEIEVAVGEQTYRNVFNTCFNLSFHEPVRVSCETCTEFENATPQQKTLLEEKYQTHLVKIVVRDIKASQKLLSQNNSQSIACLAFDLQKVLNVPSGENGLSCCTHELAVYNLTITDLVNKDGFCYTWDQTTAKRGDMKLAAAYIFVRKNI